MKPYFHSQNLNEDRKQNIIGSMFWHGRAWYHTKREWHCEWLFGRKATDFSAYLNIGDGECDDGFLLHICIPFLFSLYLGVAGFVKMKKAIRVGMAIHNQALWTYTFSSSSDPWWRKGFHWRFPWSYDWYSTEVLKCNLSNWHRLSLPWFEPIWKETRGDRRKGRDVFKSMDDQNQATASVTEEYAYTYNLKDGTVQDVMAKIHVERRVWRMRWWPLLPFSKSSTTISVDFSGEVGEGTGSYKGGTIGCGYDMLPGETPCDTLRRMERERKFDC